MAERVAVGYMGIYLDSTCPQPSEQNNLACLVSPENGSNLQIQQYYYIIIILFIYYYKLCSQIEVPEHSNCRLVLTEGNFLESAGLELGRTLLLRTHR